MDGSADKPGVFTSRGSAGGERVFLACETAGHIGWSSPVASRRESVDTVENAGSLRSEPVDNWLRLIVGARSLCYTRQAGFC